MSDRGLTAAALAEIAKQQSRIAHLAELYLTNDSPQETVYMTDAGMAISWNGNSYVDTVGLMSIDGAQEAIDLSVTTLSFALSGTELANLSIALNYNFTDVRFVVRRALINYSSSPFLIKDPFVIWDGRIDSWEFKETPETGESTLTWNSSNHWVDFQRVTGRQTNNASQQLFYSGDLGLQYFGTPLSTLKWPA